MNFHGVVAELLILIAGVAQTLRLHGSQVKANGPKNTADVDC